MATLVVNGESRSFDGDPSMPLLWYLRDVAGLTGTKYGCGVGACGACTIHLDGVAVRSCMTTIDMADGKGPMGPGKMDAAKMRAMAEAIKKQQGSQ